MSRAKTILLYTDESTAGGVAHYNHDLLPALVAAGWRTFSVQPPNNSPMLVKQSELGVQQRFLSYDPTCAFCRSFTDTTDPERIFAEVQPDLICFSDCCPLSNIAAKHVAITRNIPFVVTSHSAADYLAQRFPACVPIAKRQLEIARNVIAISQKNLDVLRTYFGLAPDKGKVVLNGRPPAFFAPTDRLVRRRIRAELGVPEDGVLCFTSARFDTAKGYQHQLAAIGHLHQKKALGNLYFAWAGTGDCHAEFAAAITQNGLDARIRLLGQRWDIADLLDASDLFVLTTMLEGGLPLSVMEAMAKGIPCIVTSVSGIADVAEDGCRLLPDPNTQPTETARALSESLVELDCDPARRATLGQAGLALAQRKFRLETNLQKTLVILDACLEPRVIKPAPVVSKEAFLLRPTAAIPQWSAIVRAYIRLFTAGAPVALVIVTDASALGAFSPAVVQEEVMAVVRESGKAAFADILLNEATELAATLSDYTWVHSLPFASDSEPSPSAALTVFRAALRETMQRTAATPVAESKARLLTIIDYAVQPYSIGDFLVYLMGSLVAAESAGMEKVDLCLLSDPSRPHADPIMRSRVNAQNHHSHLMSFLPLVELHPRLGSLFVFDKVSEMEGYLANAGGSYDLWPSSAALDEKKYMYYDIFKMVKEHHRQRGEIPQFRFSASLADWTNAFFRLHGASAVPVTVNLRNNPHYHANRNYSLTAWKKFFERCHETVPVKFIIAGAASEVAPSLRTLPNVVFAKDHQTTLLQDMALIHFAAFHLGSSSGPATLAMFGTKPYYIFNCDSLPYLAHYGGAVKQNGAGELQCSFAQKLQSFGVGPETADGIWQQFQKIWSSRDWPADWMCTAAEAKPIPVASLA
jgi:glycosyltransferase involved in cell wall biosynthesis